MENVTYRADSEQANLAGTTLADVRAMYEHQFNIPTDAAAMVNGKEIEDEQGYVIKPGDKVEFSKAQKKGS